MKEEIDAAELARGRLGGNSAQAAVESTKQGDLFS